MVSSVSFGFFRGASGGNDLVAKRGLCKHLGFLNPHVSFYRACEIHKGGMQPSQTAQTSSQGNSCDQSRANFIAEMTLAEKFWRVPPTSTVKSFETCLRQRPFPWSHLISFCLYICSEFSCLAVLSARRLLAGFEGEGSLHHKPKLVL